jgi:RNA-directed DNA polymerase
MCLDEWFEKVVNPRLKGKSIPLFADDAVMAFEDFLDAQRVLGVLCKRLARYELTLHPDKTRFVDLRFRRRPDGNAHPKADGMTLRSSASATYGASRGTARTWCGK